METKRKTFLWQCEWNQLELFELSVGDIFYMEEPTGEKVSDLEGNDVFVATSTATFDPDFKAYSISAEGYPDLRSALNVNQ